MARTVRAIVVGRVQGVYFRAYTQEAASGLGLKGWVRNLPDGSVETLISGEPEQVERMVAWLHQGSPMSLVREVQVYEVDGDEEFAGFDIRYR